MAKLTERSLAMNEITWVKDVVLEFQLCDQAALVADGLLNFEHTLSESSCVSCPLSGLPIWFKLLTQSLIAASQSQRKKKGKGDV